MLRARCHMTRDIGIMFRVDLAPMTFCHDDPDQIANWQEKLEKQRMRTEVLTVVTAAAASASSWSSRCSLVIHIWE